MTTLVSTFQEEVEDVTNRVSVFEKILLRENTMLAEINTTDKVSAGRRLSFD